MTLTSSIFSLFRVRRSRRTVLYLGIIFGVLFFCFYSNNSVPRGSRALHGTSLERQAKHVNGNDFRNGADLLRLFMKEEGNQVSGRPMSRNTFPFCRTAAKCTCIVCFCMFNEVPRALRRISNPINRIVHDITNATTGLLITITEEENLVHFQGCCVGL